jgi:hypothetical protein
LAITHHVSILDLQWRQVRMARNYWPYLQQPAPSPRQPDQAPPPWWRPLTRWWGIFGVIIFIGLVMWLIENSGFRPAKRPISPEPAKPALMVEQPSRPLAPRQPIAQGTSS